MCRGSGGGWGGRWGKGEWYVRGLGGWGGVSKGRGENECQVVAGDRLGRVMNVV